MFANRKIGLDGHSRGLSPPQLLKTSGVTGLTAAGEQLVSRTMAKSAADAHLPLLRAVKEGHYDKIVSLLGDDAIDVNFQNHYGDSALILSAWYGHINIVQQLVEARADVDQTNCDGNCALNCAAYHGYTEVAQLLLDHGATIDVQDCVTGKTGLIKAAYVGHAEVADLLVRAGANKDAADNQGYTALAFATSFNHVGVLQVLLDGSANPNVQDEFGITPLIHAAARGFVDAVRLLLGAGAKLDLADLEGKTAVDYAQSAGLYDVLDALQAGSATELEFMAPTPRGGGRMTPRVPHAGDVKMTPRGPAQSAPGADLVIAAKQVATLGADSMLYLTKKLVHLALTLEQDTVAEDTAYPSFYTA